MLEVFCGMLEKGVDVAEALEGFAFVRGVVMLEIAGLENEDAGLEVSSSSLLFFFAAGLGLCNTELGALQKNGVVEVGTFEVSN